MQLSPEEKMTKARTQLLLRHPFFGYFLTHLRFVGDAIKKFGVPTACVIWDRKSRKYLSDLHYNPDFIAMLTVEEVQGVQVHEMMHILLANEQRRENREEDKWRLCAEIAVNDTVLNAGFSLPTLADFTPILPDETTHNKTIEEIYELLPPGHRMNDVVHVILSEDGVPASSSEGTIGSSAIDEKKLKEIISEAAA